MLGGEHDDHDVGDAGQWQGDEGAVDDGDEEETKNAKAEEHVHEGVAGSAMDGGSLRSGCCEELRDDRASCKKLHTRL